MFEQKRSFIWIVINFLIGLVILLSLVWIGNYLEPKFNNLTYSNVVQIFNSNLAILIIISVIYFIADIFLFMSKPFDLLAPPFKAVGSAVLVSFIFQIFYFMNSSIGSGIEKVLDAIRFPVYIIVILIILISGYFSLYIKYSTHSKLKKELAKFSPSIQEREKEREEIKQEIKKEMENVKQNIAEAVQLAIKEVKESSETKETPKPEEKEIKEVKKTKKKSKKTKKSKKK